MWFEPDFIILKKWENNEIKQLFIEIKESGKAETWEQKWKNNLLINLNLDKEVNGIKYKIKWLPFFTEKIAWNKKEEEKFLQEIEKF